MVHYTCYGIVIITFGTNYSAGEYDHLPEMAFYMVGPIEEVVQKAEQLAQE